MPEACKDVADIVEVMDRAGIVPKVAKLVPLAVVKRVRESYLVLENLCVQGCARSWISRARRSTAPTSTAGPPTSASPRPGGPSPTPDLNPLELQGQGIWVRADSKSTVSEEMP